MKKSVVFIITIAGLLSLGLSTDVNDEIKNRMFCCACRKSGSTSRDYVVVKVKNTKTGALKEICVTLNLLEGAMWRERSLFGRINCEGNSKRYFEFSEDSALSNIGFNEYSTSKLSTFQKQLNIDSIVKQIKMGKLYSVNFGKNERYFAHVMFNNGVVTTSGCFGTSVFFFNDSCEE